MRREIFESKCYVDCLGRNEEKKALRIEAVKHLCCSEKDLKN